MLAPKFHLQHELHLFNSFASLEPILPANSWLGSPVNFNQKGESFALSDPPGDVDFYRDLFVKRPTADAGAVTRVRRTALNRYELELETKQANEEIVVMLQVVPGWQVEAKSKTDGKEFEPNVITSPATFRKPSREDYGLRFRLAEPDFYTVTLTYAPTELTVGVWISAASWGLLLIFFVVNGRRKSGYARRKNPASLR